jgi:hypothetical protein
VEEIRNKSVDVCLGSKKLVVVLADRDGLPGSEVTFNSRKMRLGAAEVSGVPTNQVRVGGRAINCFNHPHIRKPHLLQVSANIPKAIRPLLKIDHKNRDIRWREIGENVGAIRKPSS